MASKASQSWLRASGREYVVACRSSRIPPAVPVDISVKIWPGQPDNWTPPPFSPKEKARAYFGLSACFYVLAFTSYSSPSASSQSGRWGWLHQIFYVAFGTSGDIVAYCLAGTVLLVLGVIELRRAKREG
jgi:hypothetical protein